MSPLLDVVLKASLVVALALAAAGFLRRQSAALRHWVIAAGLVGAAIVPVVRPVAPGWTLAVIAPAVQPPLPSGSLTWLENVDAGTSNRAASRSTRVTPFPLAGLLWIVWITGAAVSLGVLLVGLLRLVSLTRGASAVDEGDWTEMATSIGLSKRVVLLRSDWPNLPVTFGIWRPRIILPANTAEWSDGTRRVVLIHEHAHIRRGDWLMLLAAEIVRSMYWFNPLVWIAVTRLRQEGECACDDAVLDSGMSGETYATHLLSVARWTLGRRTLFEGVAAAMARPSSLERRVRMMLNNDVERQPISGVTRLMTLTAAAAITIAAAGYGVLHEPVVLAAPFGTRDVSLPTTKEIQLGRAQRLLEFVRQSQTALQNRPVMSRTDTPGPQIPLNSPSATNSQAFSTFYGVVFDPTNRIVPGVKMSLVNDTTQARYEVMTDGTGRYEFVGLPPGEYSWQASLAGYASSRGRIAVSGRSLIRQDVDLRLGTLSELIMVVARTATATPDGAPARANQRVTVQNLAARLEQARIQDAVESCPGVPPPNAAGGNVRPAKKIHNVDPIYPVTSLSFGVSGIVILEAVIDVNGNVGSAVVRKPADPELDRAAVDAVQQWQFIPTLMNCTPVETRFNVSVNFSVVR